MLGLVQDAVPSLTLTSAHTQQGQDAVPSLTLTSTHTQQGQAAPLVGAAHQLGNTGEGQPASQPTATVRTAVMFVCKVLLLVLSIIVLAHSRTSGVRKAAAARPFFPEHSLVWDFYAGEVRGLQERLVASDLSLVMYYAPWDRHSQLLRPHLEKVARYHHEQVYVAAINCWQPGSECRTRYKIRQFPALVLHVRSGSGLETRAFTYNGPRQAAHIIRYLSRAVRPLTHLSSHAQLARLQLDYTAVVVGYFDFSPGMVLAKGFTSYYLAALRSLGQPATSRLAWAVVTSPATAAALSLNQSHPLQLVLWNTTLMYSGGAGTDSEALYSWVMKRVSDPATWLHLPGTKSQVLDSLLHQGPTLLLYTPDNPYHQANQPFTLLREVAMEYHNCGPSARVASLVRYLGWERSRGRADLRQAHKLCGHYLHQQLARLAPEAPHTVRPQQPGKGCGGNVDGVCGDDWQRVCAAGVEEPSYPASPHHDTCASPTTWWEEYGLVQRLLTAVKDSCEDLVMHYSPWTHQYSKCSHHNTTTTPASPAPSPQPTHQQPRTQSGEGGQVDDRVALLLTMAAEEQCKQLLHGSLVAPPVLLPPHHLPAPSIEGLGCHTNRSLTFMAVDSLQHQAVAERVGANLSAHQPLSSAALILDLHAETHFILDASLSKHTLAHFILNYTNGLLDRALVSGQQQSSRGCEDSQVCVVELTSDTYATITQQPGQMVVVWHYSNGCAACTSAAHLFLTLAQQAAHMPNVTFARLNVLTNTLPWHLTFPQLPALIVYPHHRKGDSHFFDMSQPLTPASLMSFLVAHLEPHHRLALAMSSCGAECRQMAQREAVRSTTHLHHQLTSTTLQLQQVISRLVRRHTPPAGGGLELLQKKEQLVRKTQQLRRRLHHLGRVQDLLVASPALHSSPHLHQPPPTVTHEEL